MYFRPARRRVSLGFAGAPDRQVPAEFHEGSRQDFLIRHAMEAQRAARGNRSELIEFANRMLARAGDYRNVLVAVERCARRSDAAGPDGIRPSSLDRLDRRHLARELGRTISDGLGLPSGTRRSPIPRGGGRSPRMVEVQNFVDRVRERAVVQVLSPLVDPQLRNECVGYRTPGISRGRAIARVERSIFDRETEWAVRQDFSNAFDNVPLPRLIDAVRRFVPDDAFCDFYARTMRRPGRSGRGIRQGGPASPVSLNIYLHWYLDQVWPRRFPTPLFRYADDLLVLARTCEEAEEAHRLLERFAQQIGMPLKYAQEQAIFDLSAPDGATWLGLNLRKEERELRVQIADEAWEKLEDHLAVSWEKDSPALYARETIRSWVEQLGAAYREEEWPRVYSEIARRARDVEHWEIQRSPDLLEVWERAHRRQRVIPRREELLLSRGRGFADGFARQPATGAATDGCPFSSAPASGDVGRRRSDILTLYVDGSVTGRVGGWAWRLFRDDPDDFACCACDSHPRTTISRMELTAVYEGLRNLPDGVAVDVWSDSDYVVLGATRFLPIWRTNGWRSIGGGGKVRHPRLWRRLERQLLRLDVRFVKVRSHSGSRHNDHVDFLAKAAVARHMWMETFWAAGSTGA